MDTCCLFQSWTCTEAHNRARLGHVHRTFSLLNAYLTILPSNCTKLKSKSNENLLNKLLMFCLIQNIVSRKINMPCSHIRFNFNTPFSSNREDKLYMDSIGMGPHHRPLFKYNQVVGCDWPPLLCTIKKVT